MRPMHLQKKYKKKKSRETDSNRERWRALGGAPCKPLNTVGEDPLRMIIDIPMGRRTGKHTLPFGGHVNIKGNPNATRKDVITCCVVSPTNRFRYLPQLEEYDRLLSEIVLVSINTRSSKIQGVDMELPFAKVNHDILDVMLVTKCLRDQSWRFEVAKPTDDGGSAAFVVEGAGVYMLIARPRVEKITIPINGCLHSSKLNRQINLRVPKKSTDVEMECDIRVLPLNRRNLPNLRQSNAREMADLVTSSDIFDIRLNIEKEFKRVVTVRLPLPPADTEDFPEKDVAVLRFNGKQWIHLDVPYKFTKTAISFDTKILSRFIVALAKPLRQKRLPQAFELIQAELFTVRGEIVPFIHTKEDVWTLWFDCVPNANEFECINKRMAAGMEKLQQTIIYGGEPEKKKSPILGNRRNWRVRKPEPVEEKKKTRDDLDIGEREFYEIEVGGDLQIYERDTGTQNMTINYFEYLSDSFRKFSVMPRGKEEDYVGARGKMLTAIVKIWKIARSGSENETACERQCVRTFDFDIKVSDAKTYLDLMPEPEPEPDEEVVEEEVDEEPVEEEPQKPVKRVPDIEAFNRLIKPTKPPRIATRDSRVLTGKSLLAIAREIEQGLTLAIYLNINDSTITGMGFDALAKGQQLADITYRILLLWKRRTSRLKNKQVDMLIGALNEMGRPDVAEVVMKKHEENEEITSECFH